MIVLQDFLAEVTSYKVKNLQREYHYWQLRHRYFFNNNNVNPVFATKMNDQLELLLSILRVLYHLESHFVNRLVMKQ